MEEFSLVGSFMPLVMGSWRQSYEDLTEITPHFLHALTIGKDL
jgi:hypothetical protein